MNGLTPLQRASRYGYIEMCAFLIKHGADVDLKNNNGATALFIASVHGHYDVCDLLIKHGASVDI